MVKISPSNARGVSMIPGWGAKIRTKNAKTLKKNKKQEQYCNKFNNDFKKGPHPKNHFLKKGNFELIREGCNR